VGVKFIISAEIGGKVTNFEAMTKKIMRNFCG